MKRTQVIYIYLLIDPRNGETFYVGQTHDPEARLRGHAADGSSVWSILKRVAASKRKHNHWEYRPSFENRTLRQQRLALIVRDKLKPILQVVEFTTAYYAVGREQYWIDKMTAEGCNLTNVGDACENAYLQRVFKQDSA